MCWPVSLRQVPEHNGFPISRMGEFFAGACDVSLSTSIQDHVRLKRHWLGWRWSARVMHAAQYCLLFLKKGQYAHFTILWQYTACPIYGYVLYSADAFS